MIHFDFTAGMPMDIPLAEAGMLRCEKLVRVMPGKRIVCAGRLDTIPVYAKLFSSRDHWQREQQAYEKAATLEIPEVLFSGEIDTEHAFVIVTRAVENSTSLQDIALQHNGLLPEKILNELLKQYATLHDAGVLHTDPHLGNFLLQGDRLVMMDVVAFDFGNRPLASGSSQDNLAYLLAQFPCADNDFVVRALELYRQQRKLDNAGIDSDGLQSRIHHYLQQRTENFLKKIWRSSSRYETNRNFFHRSIVRRDMLSADMRSFVIDPDSVMQQAGTVMLKDGNSSTVKQLEINGSKLIVKRYNIKNPLHALKRAIQPTRAARSWHNANLLLHVGIATPVPVAMIEKRLGPIRNKAWFVYEYIEGQTARDYFAAHVVDASDRVATQICHIVRQMQKFNIAHGDLKATNFLVADDRVYLLDLDSMRQIKDKSSFNRAHEADIMRLLANWQTGSGHFRLFQKLLREAKAD